MEKPTPATTSNRDRCAVTQRPGRGDLRPQLAGSCHGPVDTHDEDREEHGDNDRNSQIGNTADDDDRAEADE
jgi:hypothetical protein